MIFQYNNCHIVSFLYCIKNEFEILHFFTNIWSSLYCIIYKLWLFISQLYFLLAIKKHINNTHTLIHLR